MRDYRRLTVWSRSHQLALDVYGLTQSLPASERFGLTSQLRRAAGSIPANIAEGAGRRTAADYGRFLDVALGSANELEYHLMLARDLGFIDPGDTSGILDRVDHIRRQLLRLHSKVTSSQPPRGVKRAG